ncbi:hypothetical protein [uncultured Devosia sp.]|uniref:hypothetical protein n=1 Tax=uncultured Devosia sp. TaxID=211434 RepID=UPI0035CB0331
MPEKTLYHVQRGVADKDFNPSNFPALEMWLGTFGKEDFGYCRRFFPGHLYEQERQWKDRPLSLAFYKPAEQPGRETFQRGRLTCRVYWVYNRYGRSVRAEIPVGGKEKWSEFFEQLDRVLLQYKMKCDAA